MRAASEAAAKRWSAVRPDFEAGILSLREIAEKHSTEEWSFTYAGLAKYAKEHAWTRSLTGRIHQRANAKVQQDVAREQRPEETAVTEAEVIEANAERIAQVRGEHRAAFRRARLLAMKLLGELEQAQTLIGFDRAVKSVVESLRSAAEAELTAYGVSKDAPVEQPKKDENVDVKELARGVAFLLTRTVIAEAKAHA